MMENLSLFGILSVTVGVGFLGALVTSLGIFLGIFNFTHNLKKSYRLASVTAICCGFLICCFAATLNTFQFKTDYSSYNVQVKFHSLSVHASYKVKVVNEDNEVIEEEKSEYKLVALVKCETFKSYNECINKFKKNEAEIISNHKNGNSSDVVSL